MSETLQVPTVPKHGIILIAVPSERMNKPVSDYKFIETPEKEKYKVIQWVTIMKSEPMPSSLMLLATGQDIMRYQVWEVYKKSDKLIFFICEKIDYNMT